MNGMNGMDMTTPTKGMGTSMANGMSLGQNGMMNGRGESFSSVFSKKFSLFWIS